MKKTLSALIISSAALGTYAHAQTQTTDWRYQAGPQGYVGASYGWFKSRGGDFDDDRDLWDVHAGFLFNGFVGLEANYTRFGRYGGDLASSRTDGFGIALVGRVPLSETWGAYAKVGQFFWDADVRTPVGRSSFDGDDTFFGIGTDFRVADHVNLVVEYNRYRIDTRADDLPGVRRTDLDTVKLGVRLQF
jgi:OmpA-OmpF porin, OOP family